MNRKRCAGSAPTPHRLCCVVSCCSGPDIANQPNLITQSLTSSIYCPLKRSDSSRTDSGSRFMDSALIDSNVPQLKLLSKGKVRDIYATSSPEHLLFVASDRISAYDVILKNASTSHRVPGFHLTPRNVREFQTRAESLRNSRSSGSTSSKISSQTMS